ncbi:MAG: LamG domain-containing protein, partial [Planctomycetes bacterium]|nr:LamG domain-containing protein [Planctomycetota bacterium]
PLMVHSVEGYYWGIFLRLCNKDNALSAWFANEVYKPVVLGTPSTARLKEGRWHHIAVTWDQALGSRYYFDGQEVASNWGKAAWFSRGLDPSTIALVHSNNIAYDELYVFDRPLTATQIARLKTENKPPAAGELPPLDFGDAWARNRRQELSWTATEQNMLALKLGATTDVRQVVPIQARSVKKESNTVFDGKPGSGWPHFYNYEFNKGNGLHVELPEPFDYMVTEGYFTGQIYDRRTLTEDGQKPWVRTEAKAYATRHRLPQSRPAGWLSFFKAVMEDKGDLPDKELVTTSRICELNFFQIGKANLDGAGRKVFYLGPADAATGKQLLSAEFVGRFGPGDRAALRLSAAPPTESAAQAIAGLRYHHLLVPPQVEATRREDSHRDADVPLRGLRLRFWLRRNLDGNKLLVSLRDPTFPGRRLLNVDFKLLSAGEERQLLDVRLDLSDRLVPAGRPLWLTFCFEKDTEILWQTDEDSSRLELLTGRKDEVMPEYLRTEQAFMLSRFRDLSEARPWGAHKEPEKEMLEFS